MGWLVDLLIHTGMILVFYLFDTSVCEVNDSKPAFMLYNPRHWEGYEELMRRHKSVPNTDKTDGIFILGTLNDDIRQIGNVVAESWNDKVKIESKFVLPFDLSGKKSNRLNNAQDLLMRLAKDMPTVYFRNGTNETIFFCPEMNDNAELNDDFSSAFVVKYGLNSLKRFKLLLLARFDTNYKESWKPTLYSFLRRIASLNIDMIRLPESTLFVAIYNDKGQAGETFESGLKQILGQIKEETSIWGFAGSSTVNFKLNQLIGLFTSRTELFIFRNFVSDDHLVMKIDNLGYTTLETTLESYSLSEKSLNQLQQLLVNSTHDFHRQLGNIIQYCSNKLKADIRNPDFGPDFSVINKKFTTYRDAITGFIIAVNGTRRLLDLYSQMSSLGLQFLMDSVEVSMNFMNVDIKRILFFEQATNLKHDLITIPWKQDLIELDKLFRKYKEWYSFLHQTATTSKGKDFHKTHSLQVKGRSMQRVDEIFSLVDAYNSTAVDEAPRLTGRQMKELLMLANEDVEINCKQENFLTITATNLVLDSSDPEKDIIKTSCPGEARGNVYIFVTETLEIQNLSYEGGYGNSRFIIIAPKVIVEKTTEPIIKLLGSTGEHKSDRCKLTENDVHQTLHFWAGRFFFPLNGDEYLIDKESDGVFKISLLIPKWHHAVEFLVGRNVEIKCEAPQGSQGGSILLISETISNEITIHSEGGPAAEATNTIPGNFTILPRPISTSSIKSITMPNCPDTKSDRPKCKAPFYTGELPTIVWAGKPLPSCDELVEEVFGGGPFQLVKISDDLKNLAMIKPAVEGKCMTDGAVMWHGPSSFPIPYGSYNEKAYDVNGQVLSEEFPKPVNKLSLTYGPNSAPGAQGVIKIIQLNTQIQKPIETITIIRKPITRRSWLAPVDGDGFFQTSESFNDASLSTNPESPKVINDVGVAILKYFDFLKTGATSVNIKSRLDFFIKLLSNSEIELGTLQFLKITASLSKLHSQFVFCGNTKCSKENTNTFGLLYTTLIEKIHKFGKTMTYIDGWEVDGNHAVPFNRTDNKPQYKKALALILVSLQEKIASMKQQNLDLMINLKEFLKSTKSLIESFKVSENNKKIEDHNLKMMQARNASVQKFKANLYKRMEEASNLIETQLSPAIKKINIVIANNMRQIVGLIAEKKKELQSELQKLEKEKQQLADDLIFTVALDAFDTLLEHAKSVPKYGEVVELVGKNVLGAAKELVKDINKPSNGNVEVEELPPLLELDDFQHIDLKDENVDSGVSQLVLESKNLPERFENEKVKINYLYEKYDSQRNKAIVPDHNEIKHTVVEIAATLRSVSDKKNSTDPKEKSVLEKIAKGAKGIIFPFGVINSYFKTEEQKEIVQDAINEVKGKMQELEKLTDNFYSAVTPMVKGTLSLTQTFASGNLIGETSASLTTFQWQIQAQIENMRKTIGQATKKLNIETDIEGLCTELDRAMSTVFSIYKDIEKDHDQQKLVDVYFVLVNPTRNISVEDETLEKGIRELEESFLISNIATAYDMAVSGFLLLEFPFADRLFKLINVPKYLKPDTNETKLTDYVDDAVKHIQVMQKYLNDKEIFVQSEIDTFFFTRDFESNPKSDYEPFQTWYYAEIKDHIKRLFLGEEIILTADVLYSASHLDVIRFQVIELELKAEGELENHNLQEALSNQFKLIMTHTGSSYFRFRRQYYVLTTPPQRLVFSFKRKNGVLSSENAVFTKITNGSVILSPYTTWKIQLSKVGKTFNKTSLTEFLDRGVNIDLHLVGKGRHVEDDVNPFVPVEVDVENYYTKDTTLACLAQYKDGADLEEDASDNAKKVCSMSNVEPGF